MRFFMSPLLPAAVPAMAQQPPAAPICTDRPTNGNHTCTVPKGMFQIEPDVFSWTTDRAGSERVDIMAFTNPLLKAST